MYDNQLQVATEAPFVISNEPMRKRLEWKRQRIEKELAEVNEAIKMLDENPLLEKFHDAVMMVRLGCSAEERNVWPGSI